MTTAPADALDRTTGEPEAPEPYFERLDQFVAWLARVWERCPGKEFHWCDQWWSHPEALLRLESLWRSFEAARLEPINGIMAWLRDCADHHLAALASHTGPFRNCTSTEGHQPRRDRDRLRIQTPPPGVLDSHLAAFGDDVAPPATNDTPQER